MFVVVIKSMNGDGVLEVNGPYEKFKDAEWFVNEFVPSAWKYHTVIKTLCTPEFAV